MPPPPRPAWQLTMVTFFPPTHRDSAPPPDVAVQFEKTQSMIDAEVQAPPPSPFWR